MSLKASGAKAAVELAIKIAGRGSTASFIGLPQPDVQLPMLKVLYKDITIRAGVASVIDQWPHLIPLLQHGRVQGGGPVFLITCRFQKAPRPTAFLMRGEEDVIKIMMTL